MRKIITVMLITLLFVSFTGAINPAVAQTTPDPTLRVAWEVAEETIQVEHSEQHSHWVFGPQPTVWIEYANGTDIAENSYRVEVGYDLFINIIIPKAFLGVGNELDSIQFWGTRDVLRSPSFGLEYNATAERWNCVAFIYVPGVEEPRSSSFIQLDSLASSFTEETDYYEVIFAITYSTLILPQILSTGMQVIDKDGRPVMPSWLAQNIRGEFGSPPIGFGIAVNPFDFSLPNYYYADIVNEFANIIHYVDVNDTFIVRMMSSVQIGRTLIPFTQLTQNLSYMITVNWTYPVGLDVSEAVLFNKDLTWTQREFDLYPFMFLNVNSSDVSVLAGYIDLTWEWLNLGGGIGMWFPHLSVIENSTIELSQYYVADEVNTGAFDDRHRIQWAGYFTNETDLDPGFGFGGIIEPEMGLVTVLDVDDKPIIARPEIKERATLKLSFRAAFIEAFVYKMDGSIANVAQQGEPLNLTLLVHRDVNELNGSIVYEILDIDSGLTALFNLTQQLKDITIEVKGSIMDGNETHYWRIDITHKMVLDFETGMPTTISSYRVNMYLRGGALLWSVTLPTIHLLVSDFDLTLGTDLSILEVMFNFDSEALSMVIERATVKVGIIQNVRIQDQYGNWTYPYWLNDTQLTIEQYNALVDSWTDQYNQIDLSTSTIWSPRNLRLGVVPYYTPPTWVVTDNGAIDLDGNIFTEDDQYFILRTGYWDHWGNITVNGMRVGVGFDPSPGQPGDEFWSENWMGVVKQEIWFTTNETFYWYHTDGSPVSPIEMVEIQSTLWADIDNDIPLPGYEYVSWLSKNRTLDLSTIPGIEQGRWTSTWFAWGTTQNFWVSIAGDQATLAHFKAEYAGLLIFNDGIGPSESAPDFSIVRGQVVTEEVTHLVLIDDVESVELRRPFGATNSSGDVIVDPDTEVRFGVTVSNVDVTIYPLQVEHSSALRGAWDFRQSYQGVIGLNSTNFDYWITDATIEEMAFDITFNVDMVEFDPEDSQTWNHAVSFKVDQVIGDWTLTDFDNSVLNGRSLAVNFFGVLTSGTATRYYADERPVTDSNSASLDASYYRFGDEDTPYAEVSMGELPYIWGGDSYTETHYSGSSTAPIGAFSIMYESASGNSVTNWNVDVSMLFMTAGYSNWGGHDIICDPVFVAYTSSLQSGASTTTTTTPSTNGEGNPATLYLIVGGVVALVVIVCVMYRRR
ncbi:hypothetical protein EU527_10020 [Candidatus Thorarchaeota archaeon]|nr:MAG: hypothetical protein EU527_10020 [Candidatus Thorarchaeota archaeon]